MATILKFDRKDAAPYFVISHSVGRGGRNQTVDVQLIQTLLNRAIDLRYEQRFKTGLDWKLMNGRDGKPIGKLKVDGICGPRTLEAILAFQNLRASLAKDGLINAISDPKKDFYESDGFVMSNTMYMLAVYSQSWTKTTLNEIKVEPLKSVLYRKFFENLIRAV